jgi:endonuclease III
MQTALDFGIRQDIEWIRGQLLPILNFVRLLPPLSPAGQLVKSLISSRTRDPVSQQAFDQLTTVYPKLLDLLAASVEDIHDLICEVRFAGDKASYLQKALRAIAAEHPDFDLSFLERLSRNHAMAWLESLNGVGPKVAAATLNFSSLNAELFVADTHVLRVFERFGIIGPKSTAWAATEVVVAAMEDWTAEDFMNLHIMIKVLGQKICHLHNPVCTACPLRSRCKAVHSRHVGSPRTSSRH